jgi:FkbM family methyltransferase
MELVPGDHISDVIAFTGFYELTLTRRIATLARRGGIFIDVGANIGYYSLLWASQNRENKVFAFEASPRNISILQRNINRNGLQKQIEVVPLAAGKETGRLKFDIGPSEQTGWGGFAVGSEIGAIEVDVVRIDEIVSSDRPIALLKVDIEGADAWAIMGCERLLKAKAINEVWFEQNKPRIRMLGIPLDAAQTFLQSVGYSTRRHGRASDESVEWSALPMS